MSVVADVESAIKGGVCLADDAGRGHLHGICYEVRKRAATPAMPWALHTLRAAMWCGGSVTVLHHDTGVTKYFLNRRRPSSARGVQLSSLDQQRNIYFTN